MVWLGESINYDWISVVMGLSKRVVKKHLTLNESKIGTMGTNTMGTAAALGAVL